jgi:serine/threonine-protein kinase
MGKYEVVKRLPAADGAAVYRAKDTATGQEVCLRILPPDLVAQPGVLDRLRREAEKIRKLRHEYLVALRELGEDHRTYFLARDYIEGSDLAAHVKAHGKLNPGEACRLLSQAAEALGAAHERGILHGRLQPGSFLITRAHGQPTMLLADLGPSLESPADADEDRPARGPSPYLAPEQIRDPTPADARTDLYALGCALFHLLAGRPPFAEGAAVEQRLQREPPDVRPLNAQVTAPLAAVLRKLMARKMEDRYDGVPALLDGLHSLIPPEETEGPEEREADLAGLDEGDEDESPAAKLAALERGQDADTEEDEEDEEERHVRLAPRPGPAPRETFDEPADDEEDAATDEAKEKAPRQPPRALIIGAAVAGGVVLLGVVIVLVSIFSSSSPRPPRLPSNTNLAGGPGPEPRPAAIAPDNRDNPQPGTPQPGTPQPGAGQEKPAGGNTGQGTAVVQEPPKPSWPVLYQPKKLVPFNDLLKQYEAPWAEGMDFPADAPVFHVNRLAGSYEGVKRKTEGGSATEKKEAKPEDKGTKPPAGDDKKDKGVKSDSAETKAEGKEAGERWFDSLAAACAAVPEGQPTIIEIADNGPLFEPAIALTGRRVHIRGAEGYHPLVVWDVAEAKEPKKSGDPAAFLTVTKGQLLLGHVNVALKWAEPPAESVAVVRATDSEVLLWNTAVSVESRHKGGVAAVRFDGTLPGKRCRLSACLTRGENLAALDVRAPRAEVLMDGCLLVGGRPPLLQVEGRKDAAPTLRAIRSTLVSGETLLRVRGAAADPAAPALHWMGWDSLLARAGSDEGGTLLDLPPAATSEAVQWQAVNCLYAGWKTLLAGRKSLEVTDVAGWHERWEMAEGGDSAIPNPWNAVVVPSPATVPPEIYTPVGTPMAYKALYDEGLLGCNLSVLPTVTDTWPVRTVARFPVPSVEMLAYDALPPIPKADDGKYHGEVLDLDKGKMDVGEHLREVQKKGQKLGANIVLRLRGTGEHKTSPIHLQGSSLVLCFEAPVDPARPLVLVPDVKSDPLKANPPQYGAIQVESGNLELLAVDIRCPDFKTALLPPYLVVVQYGNLRIHRSRLQGPLAHPPEGYWGLIREEGSGQWHPDYVRGFTLNESLLVSGKMGLHVFGFGWRGRVQNSVLVTGTDAFHFQPTTAAPYRLNTQLSLERTTVAAKRGVVYLEDTPQLPLVVEPVVVQTKECAFVNPFAGPEGKGVAEAGMVVHEGYPLQRGVLCWQGERDAFDRRLQFYALPAGTGGTVPPLAAAQPFALWGRLWGPLGERGPLLDVPFKGTLDPENLSLDPLEVPGKGSAVGANLKQLVGTKKK